MIKTMPGRNPGTGGTIFAGSDGKGSHQQALGGVHSGVKSAITGGAPLSRSMGQYGKGHSYLPGMEGGVTADPTQHAGVKQIRDGGGGIRRNPRKGGLGPGPMSAAGGAGDYSMTNTDLE